MNEVKKVHLDRQQFTISVEAYKALREYLAAIEKQPGVQPEVVREVEVRMAELLAERGIAGDKVILQEDVDFLKEQLGEPRDFKDDDGGNATDNEDASSSTAPSDAPRQLYRDPEHGMIAGVAAGLATYFAVDVLIIRLLFIVTTFAGAAGIVIYILLWILAPEAKSSSDRLKMRGKAVTVDSIKAAVDRADIPGATQRAGKTASSALQKFFRGFGKLITGILGSMVTVIGSVIMLSSMLIGTMLLFNGFEAGVTRIFPFGVGEHVALVAAMVGGVIAGLGIVLSGIALARRKAIISGWLVACLAGLLLVSLSLVSALGIDAVSRAQRRFDAAHRTVSRTMPAFQRVELDGHDTRFVFAPSKDYALDMKALSKFNPDDLQAEVKDGVLKLNSNKLAEPFCRAFCTGFTDKDLEITIYAPSLDQVSLKGEDASFSNNEPLQQPALTVTADDGSAVFLRYMRPHSATLILQKNGERTKQLVLSGLARDAVRNDIVRTTGEFGDVPITIDYVQNFQLDTDITCEGHNPLIYIGMVPQQVAITGQPTLTGELLSGKRSFDQNNVYNCIALSR